METRIALIGIMVEDAEAAEAEALEREMEADDAANPQEEEPEGDDPGDEEETEE